MDGPITGCKSVGVVPKAIAQNFQKIESIPQNSNRRLAEGSVERGKDKNHGEIGN